MTTRATTSGAMLSGPVRSLTAVLILTAALTPGLAAAATYYVAPGGSDTNPGTSPGQPFRTIGKANSAVRAGDLVLVANGTYSEAPLPSVSGTASQRVTYVGNLLSPRSVVISPRLNLNRSHVTIKGFNLAQGFAILGASRDSVAFCAVGGSRSDISGSSDCVVAWNEFGGERFWMFGHETDTLTYAYRDTVTDNRFYLSPNDATGHMMRFKNLWDCVFERNRIIADIRPGSPGAGTKWFHVRRSKFVDNSWDVTQNCVDAATCDQAGWFAVRDYTQMNLFLRDTLLLKGPGLVQFFPTNSGTYPGTVMNNNFEYCVVKADGPAQYGAAVTYQDYSQADTVRHCTFVGRQAGLSLAYPLRGTLFIDHCTIAGERATPGVFEIQWNTNFSSRTVFNNSIFFGWPGQANPHRPMYALPSTQYMVNGLRSDWNLHYGSMPADSSILINGYIWTGVGTNRSWYRETGNDGNSIYGNPLFRNASSVLSFDSRLQPGSPARNRGSGGSDIGAWDEATGDATAPAAVGDLRVTGTTDMTAQLAWTAPGDDGTSGTAWGYDLRWSDSPITEANFANSTVVLAPPRPTRSGTTQGMVVGGLRTNATTYFALKTRDDMGFWSPLSNVVSATTGGTDTTPPAAVQDLQTNP